MGYDTDMHIPGQVDFLLLCYDNKNIEGIGQSLETLLELVKDSGFKADIKGYESDYNLKIKSIEDAAIKKIQSVKRLEDVVRIIDESHMDVNELYNDYLKIIKNYVIGYFKNIDIDNTKD
jgi:hypothetical protein